MSVFYCEYHQKQEDSDFTGHNVVEDDNGKTVEYCDEGYPDPYADLIEDICRTQKEMISDVYGTVLADSANYGWFSVEDEPFVFTTKIYSTPLMSLTTVVTDGKYFHRWERL